MIRRVGARREGFARVDQEKSAAVLSKNAAAAKWQEQFAGEDTT
jgi:hypothetical protein